MNIATKLCSNANEKKRSAHLISGAWGVKKYQRCTTHVRQKIHLPSRSSLTRIDGENYAQATARFIPAAWKRMPCLRP